MQLTFRTSRLDYPGISRARGGGLAAVVGRRQPQQLEDPALCARNVRNHDRRLTSAGLQQMTFQALKQIDHQPRRRPTAWTALGVQGNRFCLGLFHRQTQFTLQQRLSHHHEEVDTQQRLDPTHRLQIDRGHTKVRLELREPLLDQRLFLVRFEHFERAERLDIGDQGKDPVVIAAQIVINLQTIISRELAPRYAGVVTVGSFHAGTKHNIISDRADLQLTVRSLNPEVREQLLSAIKRIAIGTARTAGLPEDKMPDVVVSEFSYPPTFNDENLARRVKGVLVENMGAEALIEPSTTGMGAEDFGFFTTEPYIPSVYFSVGGTPAEDFEQAKAGGPAVASHHSPLFKISAEPSVKAGVEASVLALMDLMPGG